MKSIAITGCWRQKKRYVYTYGGEHPNATCSDTMAVEIPEGWDIFQGQIGKVMVTAPWGWDYDINEVLADIKGRPAFRTMDKNGRYKTAFLKEV